MRFYTKDEADAPVLIVVPESQAEQTQLEWIKTKVDEVNGVATKANVFDNGKTNAELTCLEIPLMKKKV